MTTKTRDALRSLIGAREDLALKELEQNLAYLSVCKEQKKTEEMVEELLLRFEKPDRMAIRRHYEGEVHKSNYELKAAYIQGLRDCFLLFGFLSGNEVYI